jgi:hypothetical protein
MPTVAGRISGLVLALFVSGALVSPVPASPQILAIGGHTVANLDVRDNLTWGVGPRLHLSLPLTGISVQGTMDFFGPECGTLECDLDEVDVNLLWSPPVSFVLNPYLGAGMAFQKWEGQAYADNDSDTGFNFLFGMVLQGPTFRRFQPFVEGKYQIWNDYDNQKVLAGGILLRVF